MQRLSRTLFGCALVLFAACASLEPPSGAAAQVLEVDRLRGEAMRAADCRVLAQQLHDDLTYTHSNGRVDDKQGLLGRLCSGAVDYHRIQPEGRRVRALGDTAIVTGSARIEVESGGRLHDLSAAYTAVYRRQRGQWQLVAYHSSPQPSIEP